MAEPGRKDSSGGGIPEGHTFPTSLYTQFLPGTSDTDNRADQFSWTPFAHPQPHPDAPIGVNAGFRSWSPFPPDGQNFQNYSGDSYATPDPLFNPPSFENRPDYLGSLGHHDNPSSLVHDLSAPLDFLQASDHGRALYADAYRQAVPDVATPSSPSQSLYSGKTYDLFGANEVFAPADSFAQPQTPSPVHVPDQELFQSETMKSTPPNKPSYSEVAKQKLSGSEATSSKLDSSTAVKETAHTSSMSSVSSTSSNSGAAKIKKSKPSVTRSRSVPVEPKAIDPESRYGLDTFDDPLAGRTSWSSQSGESSRKGSFSSEDIEKPAPINVYDIQGPGPGSGSKYHSQMGDIGAPSKATKVPEKKAKNVTKNKPFFDPKRIFGEQKKCEQTSKSFIPNNQQNFHFDEADAVLNNGKMKSHWKTSSAKYINNDLRDSKKQTNTEARNTMYESSYMEGDMPTSNTGHGKRQRVDASTGTSTKKSSATMTDDPVPKSTDPAQSRKPKKDHPDLRKIIGVWILIIWEWIVWAGKKALSLLWKFTALFLSVLFLVALVAWYYIKSFVTKCWDYITTKVPFMYRFARDKPTTEESFGFNPKSRLVGLKENIILPATGDEALKRLLSCKGKDPYSILGLKVDATDEDIKRYYRRQAVLVHPDKNQQPGAEEAFKILGHAIELIGEPEKRREYDLQRNEAQEQEAAMQEFSDLLTQLHQKMEEASNMMRCDHCGGKHQRIPMEFPAYSARFCSRCNIRHPAKEGDVWAESKVLGFYWNYYACMEGRVYDITQWASCQHESFKCLQANAHQVIYRISTGAGSRHRANTSRTNDDLEDFLSNLFHQQQSSATRPPNSEPQSGKKANWNQSASAKKGGRRKKKKH